MYIKGFQDHIQSRNNTHKISHCFLNNIFHKQCVSRKLPKQKEFETIQLSYLVDRNTKKLI